MKSTAFLLLSLIALTPHVAAQTESKEAILTLVGNVKPHKKIDANWRRFGEAVRKQDATIVAGLFAEDANYLSQDQDILQGRGNIENLFSAGFDRARARGSRRESFYRIVERRVYKNFAYDVGIYTNKIYRDEKLVRQGSAKFVVIWERVGKDWKIKVDSDSSLKPIDEKQ